MAKAEVDGRVKAFRSEVNTLRNVIRRTVNEVIRGELEDVESLKRKQKIIESSLKKAETKSSLLQDLKPLNERMDRIETGLKSVERTAESFRRNFESTIKEAMKGRKLEGVLEGIVESRLDGFNKKITALRGEIDTLRGELESSRVKRLEEELERRMGRLKSELARVAAERQGREEAFESDIRELKREMGEVKSGGQAPKEINVEELRRDLEIIKTKQEWIENNIERIDIKPLLRKMEELEHRIRLINVSSPIVLE